jgi:hypothetical protein
MTADYRQGLAVEAEQGQWSAGRNRVIGRAILRDDAAIEASDIVQPFVDVREAIVWEIVNVGPGVVESLPINVGDHIVQASTAADVLDHTDKACRFYTFHVDDILAVKKMT